MSNYHLRDKNLSLKAKGLLSVMLSLPEDWDYSISGLCSILKENKTAIKSALRELQDNGYVVVTKKYASKGSNRISYEYDIMEIPQSVEADSLGIGFLHLEDQPQINTNKEIIVTNTSCNVVDFTTFKEEIIRNNFKIIKCYISSDIPNFDKCICAIISK